MAFLGGVEETWAEYGLLERRDGRFVEPWGEGRGFGLDAVRMLAPAARPTSQFGPFAIAILLVVNFG